MYVQIQMKKLTTAGKKMYLSIVLQFYPAHSEAFFIVTNVRLSDCFTSFIRLVTSVLRRTHDLIDNDVIHVQNFYAGIPDAVAGPAIALQLIPRWF